MLTENKHITRSLLIAASVLLAACARQAAPPTSGMALARPEPRATLAPGDLIEVKLDYYPELSEPLLIRADGKIALRKAGEIQAAGLTPQQLQSALVSAYQPRLKRPSLTVLVRQLAPFRIFVGGEVRAPGEKIFLTEKGAVNVLQAIIAAGGFVNASARNSKVLVIRYGGDRRTTRMIDLQALTADGEGNAENFYLAENDIVYVTRLKIDQVDQWVDQHINMMIPDGIRYTQAKGNMSYGYAPTR